MPKFKKKDPSTRFVPQNLEKLPFSCFGPILPPFLVYARKRVRLEKKSFPCVFLFTNEHQSRAGVAPSDKNMMSPCSYELRFFTMNIAMATARLLSVIITLVLWVKPKFF